MKNLGIWIWQNIFLNRLVVKISNMKQGGDQSFVLDHISPIPRVAKSFPIAIATAEGNEIYACTKDISAFLGVQLSSLRSFLGKNGMSSTNNAEVKRFLVVQDLLPSSTRRIGFLSGEDLKKLLFLRFPDFTASISRCLAKAKVRNRKSEF